MFNKFPGKFIDFIKFHKIISVLVIIVIAVLIFVFKPGPTPVIETQIVKNSNLVQSVSVSGAIGAKEIANISPLSSGPIVYIGVKLGDSVFAGQTIAVLDQRIMQKNLEASLLDYSKDRNTFNQVQSDNQNRNPNQALNDAMKRILEDNQYDLEKSVNSVELKDLVKQQSVISSPINGVLTRADALTVGSTVSPSTIFTILNPESLVFNMDVDEADIGKIKTGQKVNLTIDSFPDQNLSVVVTRIDFVSHVTSNGANAFTVESSLDSNEKDQYRVGMNGDSEIITASKSNALPNRVCIRK